MNRLKFNGLEQLSKGQMQEISGGSCSVTCGAGYYSCCTGSTCECRDGGSMNVICDSGGKGSSGCSVGMEES